MPIHRVPLTFPIESRTNSLAKDSYSRDCYFESRGQIKEVFRRPGTTKVVTAPVIPSYASQGMYTYTYPAGNTALALVANNTLYNVNSANVSNTLGTMTGTAAICSFNQTGSSSSTTSYMTVHNQSHLYTISTGINFAVASQLDTILTSLSLYSGGLCPGIVYLDGYTVVMTTTGRIYNSAINDPTTWNALSYVTAEAEADGGIGIVKHFNYIVAFGVWSTEFFMDNGPNPASPYASPFLRADSYRLELGCANGQSIAQADQTVLWVGKSKSHGKAVYMFNGLSPIKVSTPSIERYLNADQTDDVTAYVFKIAGHTFYVMTLINSNLTFVFDLNEQMWYNWSFTASYGGNAIAGKAIAGIAIAGAVTDIVIASSTPTAIAGNAIAGRGISGIAVAGRLTDVLGITLPPGSYFRPSFYSEFNLSYYSVDAATSEIYTMSTSVYQDNGNPIYSGGVSPILDLGTTKRKRYHSMEVVGDKCAGNLYLRNSENDYSTWSPYRAISLSAPRSIIYQCASGRRRAWQWQCYDNVPLRLEAFEVTYNMADTEE